MKPVNRDIQTLIRDNVKRLIPYSAARYQFHGKKAVLLDANENPISEEYGRYPDPYQHQLKDKLARLRGTNSDQVFIGNGADEIIDLMIRAFCEPGVNSIIVTDPTYDMYQVCAGINGVAVTTVALNADFTLDDQAILASVNSNTKLIFICSPGNPGGNLIPAASILSLVNNFPGLVVIDEAYIDFSQDPGIIPYLGISNGLVVIQTLSKAWGLAALRLGYAFADTEVIAALNKIKPPYNVGGPAQKIALERLEDENTFKSMRDKILRNKEDFIDFLNGFSHCEEIKPSDTNFLLVRFSNAKEICEYLKANNIIVRDRTRQLHCEDCLRISIGNDSEMEILKSRLKEYENEKKSTVHRS